MPADESETQSRTAQPAWRVLKYGGTSVATPERWATIRETVDLRTSAGTHVVLVCSAISGVTNLLTQLVTRARDGGDVTGSLREIRQRHEHLAGGLEVSAADVIGDDLERLERLARGTVDVRAEAEIMACGELMSTRLGAAYLSARGARCAWVDARDLLRAETPAGDRRDEHILSATCSCEPDRSTREALARIDADVIVTQGYIARTPAGETALLGRGGSDTSAAYLACKLVAERLEIWTDVPGLFTANPRVVPDARLLERVGYREAQALGALGAKVLHPRAIEAAWAHGIPVEIGWTRRPRFEGTCINASRATRGIKAITSRRQLAMFALRRPPSWQPVGFLSDVAACFAERGLSMDLVSSSCSEIRVTVDLAAFPSAEAEIPALLASLEKVCVPRVVHPVASVSIVGERVGRSLLGTEGAFGPFAEEAVFMVVHAANEHHVTFVMDEHAADHLVRNAHRALLGDDAELHDLGPTWGELTAPDKKDEEAA